MDKDARNAIERATQRARKLLEDDFAAQLEGVFDVHRDGALASKAGSHLATRQVFQRERIVAAIEHKRAAGMTAADSVADYLRDAAFTTLNRFVALKMLEARELVQECITKGEQSAGYREFCGMASGLPLLPDSVGYRLYIESLFDELSTEVKVLFDRRDPSSVLWPKRATFEQLLDILNAAELANVWREDETIGWAYQFFNGQDERRKMREESPVPRNSRELAVRNQFFTPRYVVQFLTDNTLGRIWYEMRGAKTILADRCEYMVGEPGEEFATRAKKDPRDIHVLDPACGSGHFLLYAFELLLAIYEEAHADPESPKSEATGRTLAEDYPSIDVLRSAVPGLILAHNLHGVDIDARCAQIAQLALWMRAQKAYSDFGIARAGRQRIRRSNIIIAEPLVADDLLFREFVAELGDAELGRVFIALADALELAGDLGFLVRIETLVAPLIKQGKTGELFAPPEERIRSALARFVAEEGERRSTRRRLFGDDAAQGVGLLAVAEKKFDVVLMNPPFGDSSTRSRATIKSLYPNASHDIAAAFVARALSLLHHGGAVGAITTRTCLFIQTYAAWRNEMLRKRHVGAVLDLGFGVLDAMVETAAYVVWASPKEADSAFISALDVTDKSERLRAFARSDEDGESYRYRLRQNLFLAIPGAPMAYWVPATLLKRFSVQNSLSQSGVRVSVGLQTGNNDRFLRLVWEVNPSEIALDGSGPARWALFAKGGEFATYLEDLHCVVRWADGGSEIRASTAATGGGSAIIKNEGSYFRDGLTYPYRTTSALGFRILPVGVIPSDGGWGVYQDSANSAEELLAAAPVLNSRFARYWFEILLGGGDSSVSGSAARNHGAETISGIPWPELSASTKEALAEGALEAWLLTTRLNFDIRREAVELLLTASSASSLQEVIADISRSKIESCLSLGELHNRLEQRISEAYGFTSAEVEAIVSQQGANPFSLPQEDRLDSIAAGLEALRAGTLLDWARERVGGKRYIVKKAYSTARALELLAHGAGVHPSRVVEEAMLDDLILLSDDTVSDVALDLLHDCLARVWGYAAPIQQSPEKRSGTSKKTARRVVLSASEPCGHRRDVLVDDPGHSDDVMATLESLIGRSRVDEFGKVLRAELRDVLRKEFFEAHRRRMSKSRRSAPIYWQLSTPTASYSVWLYVHAFSKDTLFRVQNDYAAPKFAHEVRRLESLTSEMREKATTAQRKELAALESLVEELRAFLEEVKRVAPLWSPNLDDGVIINFAPLWRLVPQHKPWQKELKSTWDALCDGEYDWAHLAMHLWPERVVPKCAKDRSLAIAHGLENVFWVEGTDGKWTARKTPTRETDELVRERTSPAVKSALKSLLDAPAATGNRGRAQKRGGRRRSAAAAADGGDV